ncbi:Uncharacterised protein [Mycobacteroides abscessus subsp. abscessus]|nr:Uncharacterised protein [Mycobacteroides abscessus subsp. abscessus]
MTSFWTCDDHHLALAASIAVSSPLLWASTA